MRNYFSENENGICFSHLMTGIGREFEIQSDWIRDVFFAEAKRQIDAYFSGSLNRLICHSICAEPIFNSKFGMH